MANQPIDKGRVVVIAEKYQSGNDMKNRYATVGRATKWPPNQGSNTENVDIEIDTMPINPEPGPVKMYIFWDSDSNQNSNGFNQGGQQQGGGFNQGGGQPQGGYNQGGQQQY
jgi:uncharacterized membrane protein YgcG